MTRRRSRGFTLIEMLIYLALLAVVSSAVFSFILWSMHAMAKAKAIRETTDQADRLVREIVLAVREAKSVYVPTSVFENGEGRLSLEIFDESVAGEPLSFVDFYRCGSRVCKKEERADPIALTQDSVSVDELRFEAAGPEGDPRSVRIRAAVSFKTPSNRPQFQSSVTLETSATLR